jgi:hypothetical protein
MQRTVARWHSGSLLLQIKKHEFQKQTIREKTSIHAWPMDVFVENDFLHYEMLEKRQRDMEMRRFWGFCVNRFGMVPYTTFPAVPILASNFRRYS